MGYLNRIRGGGERENSALTRDSAVVWYRWEEGQVFVGNDKTWCLDQGLLMLLPNQDTEYRLTICDQ
jgi:hypothetical protein